MTEVNPNNPIYIVTGTTGGIGSVIAESVAAERKPLVLACRNMQKAEEQCVLLKKKYGYDDIHAKRLDLGSFAGVKAFCEEIRAMNRPIAALVNNAGVMSRDSVLSEDGYEQDFQVNTFSTALLALLMEPMLQDGAVVVFTTSVTRNVWRLPKCFPQEKSFGQLATYGRSKRAMTMFAVALAEKLKCRGIWVNCADPGVVDTGMITMQRWFDPLADVFFRPFISSPEKGASSAINAMKSGKTGKIYHHNRELQPTKSIVRESQRMYDLIFDVLKEYL